jgi:hypothetical protein
MMRAFYLAACLAVIMGAAEFCFAQDAVNVSGMSMGIFGGAGIANQSALHGCIHLGATIEGMSPFRGGIYRHGMLMEGGYIVAVNDSGFGSAILSLNYEGAFMLRKSSRISPFFTGGYTRLFGTGNAANYGTGIDLFLTKNKAWRFEVRDYFRSSGREKHNLAFRIGFSLSGKP